MQNDWQLLQDKLKARFGSEMEHDAILFLIGVQELGKLNQKFKKDQKMEIMHIAICTLLSPFGFYEYKGRDEDGWPHWEVKEQLPHLEAKQQNKLINEAILEYFKQIDFL